MECPHCKVHFFDERQDWTHIAGIWSASVLTCPACDKIIVAAYSEKLGNFVAYPPPHFSALGRPPATEVPETIAEDYREASMVLELSPKASAALSRRCLQNMLTERGYEQFQLANQIKAFLDSEPPSDIADLLRAINDYGNFAAHPKKEHHTGEIVNVEPGEAVFCLEILESLFDHFYVRPAKNAKRLKALEEKRSKIDNPKKKQGQDAAN